MVGIGSQNYITYNIAHYIGSIRTTVLNKWCTLLTPNGSCSLNKCGFANALIAQKKNIEFFKLGPQLLLKLSVTLQIMRGVLTYFKEKLR